MSEVQSTVEYRTLPEYDGYRFGSDGSIWTCWKKKGNGGRNGCSGIKSNQWRRMKGTIDKGGYIKVTIKLNGKRAAKRVHCLILEAFIGRCPPGMQACHSPDWNPANNAISNLRWDTGSANQQDAIKHGRRHLGLKEQGRKFITTWNSCASLAEFCAKTGRTTRKAVASAYSYRSQGYELKKLSFKQAPSSVMPGEKFGKWTILELRPNRKRLCQCDCGTIKEVHAGSIASGRSRGCYCWKR